MNITDSTLRSVSPKPSPARRRLDPSPGLGALAALSLAAALTAPIGCGNAGGAEPLELEAASTPLLEPLQSSGDYTVTITNDDPALSDETFFQVYPQLRERFNLTAPAAVGFHFIPNLGYPAFANPTEIVFSSTHFIENPEDWDVVTHEAMHLIQHPSVSVSWLIEGIADYVRDEYGVHNEAGRWALEETPGKYYNAGYKDAALFLQSIERSYAPRLVDDLTAALRANRYSEDLWVEYTGLTLDQLWDEYEPSFPLRTDVVTLFPDPHYADYPNVGAVTGDTVTLAPGNYAVSDLIAAGVLNDVLSSLWVPAGLEVQLFLEGDFSGSSLTFSRNVPDLAAEGADNAVQLADHPAPLTFGSGL